MKMKLNSGWKTQLQTTKKAERERHNLMFCLNFHLWGQAQLKKNIKTNYSAFFFFGQCFPALFNLSYFFWTDPMCMAKIIWLSMILVIIVFTISIVIYKIVYENGQNCK